LKKEYCPIPYKLTVVAGC